MREDPFARTLRDLEDTLAASHIAVFPVWCCLPSDDVAELKRRISPEGLDYSFVPVRNDVGRITGVVHRDGLVGKNGTVGTQMAGLTPGQVVEARSALRSTIEALGGRSFLLVYSPESGQPDGIGGIITRADVQKTPVRLLLFAQLIEIETQLRRRLAGTKWYERNDCKREWSSATGKRKACKGDALSTLDSYLGVAELLRVTRRTDATLFSKMDQAGFEQHVLQVKQARDQVCHGLDVRRSGGSPDTTADLREAFQIIEETMKGVSPLGNRRR